ncbi:collagen alpha-1(I) chain-like [Choloepus didactylus]|uniref:collagen alpha-1(I) chain-like n=1 Tax=Choloepus didactylus TaxID=27675 RepID=UPI00189F8EB7|nr:collagen alpha-1(I) chain-like [Choloepus didactylus]
MGKPSGDPSLRLRVGTLASGVVQPPGVQRERARAGRSLLAPLGFHLLPHPDLASSRDHRPTAPGKQEQRAVSRKTALREAHGGLLFAPRLPALLPRCQDPASPPPRPPLSQLRPRLPAQTPGSGAASSRACPSAPAAAGGAEPRPGRARRLPGAVGARGLGARAGLARPGFAPRSRASAPARGRPRHPLGGPDCGRGRRCAGAAAGGKAGRAPGGRGGLYGRGGEAPRGGGGRGPERLSQPGGREGGAGRSAGRRRAGPGPRAPPPRGTLPPPRLRSWPRPSRVWGRLGPAPCPPLPSPGGDRGRRGGRGAGAGTVRGCAGAGPDTGPNGAPRRPRFLRFPSSPQTRPVGLSDTPPRPLPGAGSLRRQGAWIWGAVGSAALNPGVLEPGKGAPLSRPQRALPAGVRSEPRGPGGERSPLRPAAPAALGGLGGPATHCHPRAPPGTADPAGPLRGAALPAPRRSSWAEGSPHGPRRVGRDANAPGSRPARCSLHLPPPPGLGSRMLFRVCAGVCAGVRTGIHSPRVSVRRRQVPFGRPGHTAGRPDSRAPSRHAGPPGFSQRRAALHLAAGSGRWRAPLSRPSLAPREAGAQRRMPHRALELAGDRQGQHLQSRTHPSILPFWEVRGVRWERKAPKPGLGSQERTVGCGCRGPRPRGPARVAKGVGEAGRSAEGAVGDTGS